MNRFIFLSSRLNFLEVTRDELLNIELCHYLSVFENHVYGVLLQYDRIKSALEFSDLENMRRVPGPQANLDIYYYTMTWDKLKKIYEKFKRLMKRVQKAVPSLSEDFISDYRIWKRRIDALFPNSLMT
ncbi:MAG: hypothetical protein V2A69_12665 [Pseudomonadota bacterium]